MNAIKGQLFHQRLIPWVPVAHLLQCDSFPNHSSEFSAGLLPTASPLLPNSSGLAHTCSGREASRFQTGARQRPSHLRCPKPVLATYPLHSLHPGHLQGQDLGRLKCPPGLRVWESVSLCIPDVSTGRSGFGEAGPPLPATLLSHSHPRHSRPLAFSS